MAHRPIFSRCKYSIFGEYMFYLTSIPKKHTLQYSYGESANAIKPNSVIRLRFLLVLVLNRLQWLR